MKTVSQTLHISTEDWIFIYHALYSGHVPKSSLRTWNSKLNLQTFQLGDHHLVDAIK